MRDYLLEYEAGRLVTYISSFLLSGDNKTLVYLLIKK